MSINNDTAAGDRSHMQSIDGFSEPALQGPGMAQQSNGATAHDDVGSRPGYESTPLSRERGSSGSTDDIQNRPWLNLEDLSFAEDNDFAEVVAEDERTCSPVPAEDQSYQSMPEAGQPSQPTQGGAFLKGLKPRKLRTGRGRLFQQDDKVAKAECLA
jgi:hypothetical protein